MADRAEFVRGVVKAWGRILSGYRPNLSIEITRECPLRCAGCYAYGDAHLGGGATLRGLSDYKGDALVERFLALVDRHHPIHVSIVGGEPLVRYRELDVILPKLAERGIHTQLVTSAVRPIPAAWQRLPRFQVVVSVDGLPAEHDTRRAPATYDRILKHIVGHRITVHCTVTRQQAAREGYIESFLRFWQDNPDTRMIWVSLYTPQIGEVSDERLRPEDRARVLAELARVRPMFPKFQISDGALKAYTRSPSSPASCTFARTTDCFTADLERRISPCQFGGNPDCANCGCMASASLKAVSSHKLPGGIPVGLIYEASVRQGAMVARVREAAARLAGH